MEQAHPQRSRVLPLCVALLGAVFVATTACSGDDGDQGPPGPPGDPGTEDELTRGDDVPGLTVAIQSVTGGSGPGGSFRAGDKPRVNFRVQKDDGSDWILSELGSGRALVSGPTFNYQRVIAEQTDLLTASVPQTDGSYTYTFAIPIPATYLAPFNDTPSFGPEAGELTGQTLLEGTYTVGLTFGWDFTVDGEDERDSGNDTFDFVIGTGPVEPREVVKIENCNRCHDQLRVHGGRREEASVCVLCHTSGAEDKNDPNVAGGTPGVSIDFKVMIHKIHAGKHLPSVLGVTTLANGLRDYAAPPQPYLVAGNSANDFSAVAFPAWPQGLVPLPRDLGYSSLSPADQATEDTIRKGPSNCAVCHGDPDDDGPLTAPAQEDLILAQPSREACGSCHDDVLWGQSYSSNGQLMGAQANNANCKFCHAQQGNPLAVLDAHRHPLSDPTFDPGLNFNVSSLVESGANDADGTLDPGEKVQISFTIVDDAGADIDPASLSSPSVVISGPTSNYNLLLNTSIPSAALTGAPPFTVQVPMTVQLERLGVATSGTDVFPTQFAPHWNVSGALTSVFTSTLTGGGGFSTLTSTSSAPQNFVDVSNPSNFDRDDYIVVDEGTADEEYVQIQLVDGGRLWFSSPSSSSYKAGLERAHLAGAMVREMTLDPQAIGVDYSLDAPTGTITELGNFGDGNTVVASYTTDFVVPATYPLSLNDTPGLGEETGEWTGKTLVDGTYTFGIWSSRTLTLNLFGESNSYKSSSDAKNIDFLVGSATDVEPYAVIASGSSCFNCHQELAFHGFGRRGFESCVLCHGTAGAEDRPRYVAANAPETPGVTIGFRGLLHKIHMGANLANAATYEVIGHGSSPYPDNFSAANFAEVVFPALPGGVQRCAKCHGNDAWQAPAPRAHPTEQGRPIKRWTAVCGSCHDDSDAQAHINVQTDSFGNESCGVCHAPGELEDVERSHKSY